jgi:hypothetical protein
MVRNAIALGLVALASAAAGCASARSDVVHHPATTGADGQASPRTGVDAPPRCTDGSYNRAAEMCLRGGP